MGSINIIGCVWRFRNIVGCVWGSRNIKGCAWRSRNIMGYAWGSRNIVECVWTSRIIMGCVWGSRNTVRCLWTSRNTMGFVWRSQKHRGRFICIDNIAVSDQQIIRTCYVQFLMSLFGNVMQSLFCVNMKHTVVCLDSESKLHIFEYH